MNHTEQVSTAKKLLQTRRAALVRARDDNDADAVELGAEKRSEELAENDEISDVLVSLSERQSAELKELDAALNRLDLGTWGRCEKCQKAISARRMKALPEARTCTGCAA